MNRVDVNIRFRGGLSGRPWQGTVPFAGTHPPPQMAPPQEPPPSAKPETDSAPVSRLGRFWRHTRAFAVRSVQAGVKTIMLMLAALGGGQVYDATIGDGRLPSFKPLSVSAPHLVDKIQENHTESVYLNNRFERQILPDRLLPEVYWQALQPTLEILDATCPEVADWTRQHYREKRALLGMPSVYPDHFAAAYNTVSGTLLLGDLFWLVSDGDKAAILVHEYRHARQSMPKGLAVRLTQILSGQILRYKCQLEDEAYEYEGQYYEALGR